MARRLDPAQHRLVHQPILPLLAISLLLSSFDALLDGLVPRSP
jgi:hypothetical protein